MAPGPVGAAADLRRVAVPSRRPAAGLLAAAGRDGGTARRPRRRRPGRDQPGRPGPEQRLRHVLPRPAPGHGGQPARADDDHAGRPAAQPARPRGREGASGRGGAPTAYPRRCHLRGAHRGRGPADRGRPGRPDPGGCRRAQRAGHRLRAARRRGGRRRAARPARVLRRAGTDRPERAHRPVRGLQPRLHHRRGLLPPRRRPRGHAHAAQADPGGLPLHRPLHPHLGREHLRRGVRGHDRADPQERRLEHVPVGRQRHAVRDGQPAGAAGLCDLRLPQPHLRLLPAGRVAPEPGLRLQGAGQRAGRHAHLAGVGRGDDRADHAGGARAGALPRLLHDRQRAPAVQLRRQRHGRQEPRARRGPALLRGGQGLHGHPDRAGPGAGAAAGGAGGGRRRRPDAHRAELGPLPLRADAGADRGAGGARGGRRRALPQQPHHVCRGDGARDGRRAGLQHGHHPHAVQPSGAGVRLPAAHGPGRLLRRRAARHLQRPQLPHRPGQV